MKSITLFSTDGCHLCEQAIGMFYYAKQQNLIEQGVQLSIIDIVDQEEFVERYGERIPVFKNSQDQELGWPFELDAMVAWINQSV